MISYARELFSVKMLASNWMETSPGLVVTGDKEVVGSNPSTGYWKEMFSHYIVVKIVMFINKLINKFYLF